MWRGERAEIGALGKIEKKKKRSKRRHRIKVADLEESNWMKRRGGG